LELLNVKEGYKPWDEPLLPGADEIFVTTRDAL
jgi:hypothetical protein